MYTENRSGANNLTLTDGLYYLYLGEVTALSLNADEDYWLDLSTNETLSPRVRIGSSFYAYSADVAFDLNASSSVVSDAEVDNDLTISSSGSVDDSALESTVDRTDFIASRDVNATAFYQSNLQVWDYSGGVPYTNLSFANNIVAGDVDESSFNGGLWDYSGGINDANISDTLTCSDLVSGSSVVADSEVDDDITASSYLPLAGGTMAGTTDMNTNIITNIGNAGTDFDAYGGLTVGAIYAGILEVDQGDLSGSMSGVTKITPNADEISLEFRHDGTAFPITANAMIYANMGIGDAANFTQSFIQFSNAGSEVFEVQHDGSVDLNGNPITNASDVNATAFYQNDLQVWDYSGGINDANVSDTLTCSDLAAGSSVVADSEVDNDITIASGTGKDIVATDGLVEACEGGCPTPTNNADGWLFSEAGIETDGALDVDGTGTSRFSGGLWTEDALMVWNSTDGYERMYLAWDETLGGNLLFSGTSPTNPVYVYNFSIYAKNVRVEALAAGYGNLSVDGSVTADTYWSGGAQGITDSSSYWLCSAADCSTKCQVTIADGLITGCT